MAQLPVYRQQGNITTDTPGQIRDLNTYAQGSIGLQRGGNALYELAAKWQESKDAVENLNGRNKLSAGLSEIINEARNYNDYSTPEELQQKEQELTDRMNNLVPEIVSGFSNNQRAREFESNGQFVTQQNTFKLQDIFRQKYGDMYNATLQDIADRSLKSYTMTGDEAYKQEYFDALDTGMKAGYISREQAEKLKLGTDDWNYSYVYSQILENPYFKISDDIMAKIDPVKQRTLRNFQRAEQKRAQQEARWDAESNFYANPTQANLEKIYKVNPGARKNPKFQAIVNTVPNYETTSNLAGYADAVGAIKDLAGLDTTSYNGKQAFMDKAGDVALKILKSNMRKDGEATLTDKEKDKAMQMLYKTMNDKTFKDQMKGLPDLKYIQPQFIFSNSPYYNYAEGNKMSMEKLKRAGGTWAKIDNIAHTTCEQALLRFAAGDVEGGKKIYNAGVKAAIREKYWFIPELQNPNLQVGTKFTVNGKVYAFQGFTQKDIIVEVK